MKMLLCAVLMSFCFISGCKQEQPPTPSGQKLPDSDPNKVGTLVKKVEPKYPPIARAAHIEGDVKLHAIIAADGTVESLEAVSGPDMLKGAAVDAVKQWVYQPYIRNGQATRVDTTVTVHFHLAPQPK